MQQSSQKLFVTLIVILGLVGGYLYYSQFGAPNEEIVTPVPKSSLSSLKSLKIDFTSLDNPLFSKLTVFGEMPVIVGPTGKVDIFSPNR